MVIFASDYTVHLWWEIWEKDNQHTIFKSKIRVMFCNKNQEICLIGKHVEGSSGYNAYVLPKTAFNILTT
jgi:hypothetical protein